MLKESLRNSLLNVATASIYHGLNEGCPLPINVDEHPQTLRDHLASFVTLHVNAKLRGCIGAIEAYRPLILDVAENAYAAAFRDPRFQPLDTNEFDQLHYHISILSVPEQIEVATEQALIDILQPGIDGLILEDNGKSSTFLPSVWNMIPDPKDFIQQLKLKAGLAADHWSDTLCVKRYHTENIE